MSLPTDIHLWFDNMRPIRRTTSTPARLGETATSRSSPTILDAALFPHIMDLIINLDDLRALVALRPTSWDMLDRVNAIIFGHVEHD